MSIVNEIKLSGKFNLLKEHFPFSRNERRRIVEFLRQRIELFMLKQWKIFYEKITSFSDSEHWIAMMKFKLLVVFAIEWSQWQSSLRLKLWQIRSSPSSVKPERGGNPSDSQVWSHTSSSKFMKVTDGKASFKSSYLLHYISLPSKTESWFAPAHT